MRTAVRSKLAGARARAGGHALPRYRNVPALPPGDHLVVEVLGGLGNQMFQYAAGRAATLRTGAELVLDLSWFTTECNQDYGLDRFAIQAASLPASSGGTTTRLPVVRERGFHHQPGLWQVDGSAYLSGYWQSPRYFEEAADVLRTEFRTPSPLSLGAIVGRDVAPARAASVHVRRGDYVADPEAQAYHGTCSPAYYVRAMSLVRALAGADVEFFLFSDDPAWAARALGGPGVQVVSTPASAPHDDLVLMSQCRHHVLANSSFSWWGAWLGEPDGVTVAPRPWFLTPENNTKDLLPPGWLTIGA